MTTATIEKLHQINPSGQVGIWAHSQNVEDDLLKQYVVQVEVVKNKGWLAMKSFNSFFDAADYMDSEELTNLFPVGSVIRIWDDRNNSMVYNNH